IRFCRVGLALAADREGQVQEHCQGSMVSSEKAAREMGFEGRTRSRSRDIRTPSSVAINQSEGLAHYRRALEATLGIPFAEGNSIRVLRNGKEIFPALLEAIEQAEHTIDFLTYVYWTGDIAERFADALIRKARQGVDVDVILDAFGAKQMNRQLVQKMEQAGVTVCWFRPMTWRLWRFDNRTHRKILVCDGAVGFTGGVGIAEEWEGDALNPSQWRDTHIRVEGPAVHGIHAAFLGNWSEMGRTVKLRDEAFPKLQGRGDAAVMSLRSVAS